MPNQTYQAGQTFIIEIPLPENAHLFIMILDPEKYTGRTIFIPIDSSNFDGCPTVEFQPGEHEFVKVRSYVSYKFAQIRDVTWLEKMIDSGKARPRESITVIKLQEIREKITHTTAIKGDIREFYLSQIW